MKHIYIFPHALQPDSPQLILVCVLREFQKIGGVKDQTQMVFVADHINDLFCGV